MKPNNVVSISAARMQASSAGTRQTLREVLKAAKSLDGKQQALTTDEIRSRFYVQRGTFPKGLSKHMNALKSDGEILNPNRGAFIWKTGEAVKPANLLFPPEKLPQRGQVRRASEYTLSAAEVTHVARKNNVKITTRQLVALADLGFIPGKRTSSGRYYYAADVLMCVTSLALAARAVLGSRKLP